MLRRSPSRRSRRAALLLAAAVGLIATAALGAAAVDVGYIVLVRTQLQSAADAAALDAAGRLGEPPADLRHSARREANLVLAAGQPVQLADGDLEFGQWESAARMFVPTSARGNAIRVTARRTVTTGGDVPLLFARLLNWRNCTLQASAVAAIQPREIALIVDLAAARDPAARSAIGAALAAAIRQIAAQNADIPHVEERDQVALVGFDALAHGGGFAWQPLTADYEAALAAALQLPPGSEAATPASLEAGLAAARDQLRATSAGGAGRSGARRVALLLASGQPGEWISTIASIAGARQRHPQVEFYPSGDHAHNAVLVQGAAWRTAGWELHPLPLGPQADGEFLGRLAHAAGASDAPGELTESIADVLNRRRPRLVE